MDSIERIVGGADRHSKKIIICLAIIITALVLFLAFIFFLQPIIRRLNAPTQISLNIAPHSATISINGKDYNNGVYELEPGEYEVTIQKDGFETKTDKVEVKSNQTNVYYNYIVSQTEGMAYFERSQADIDVLAHINTSETENFTSNLEAKLKIRDILPIEGTYNVTEGIPDARSLFAKYKIREGGGVSDYCERVFCIIVESDIDKNENLEKIVKNELSAKGFNIKEYEVKYVSN